MGSSTENRDELIKHAKRVTAERDALKADLREYRNVCEEKQDIITCEVELNKSLKAENEELKRCLRAYEGWQEQQLRVPQSAALKGETP